MLSKLYFILFVVISYVSSGSRWTCDAIRVRADTLREDHSLISYRGDGLDSLDGLDPDELEDQRTLDSNGKRSAAGADAVAAGAEFIDIPSFKPHDIPVRSLYDADGLDPAEEIEIDKDVKEERQAHVSARKDHRRRRRQIDDKASIKKKRKAKACSSVLRYWAGCNM